MEPQESVLNDIEDTQTELPYLRRIIANIINGITELVLALFFYLAMPDCFYKEPLAC